MIVDKVVGLDLCPCTVLQPKEGTTCRRHRRHHLFHPRLRPRAIELCAPVARLPLGRALDAVHHDVHKGFRARKRISRAPLRQYPTRGERHACLRAQEVEHGARAIGLDQAAAHGVLIRAAWHSPRELVRLPSGLVGAKEALYQTRFEHAD